MFKNLQAGSITDLVSGTSWPGAVLKKEIARRFAALCEMKIGKGDLVVIAHGGTPCFFADLFAVWQAGAGAACLNQTLTAPEIKTIADFVEPAAILIGPGVNPENYPLPFPVLSLSEGGHGAELSGAPADPGDEDPALILFTSGTTGNPKGVVHTFGSIRARLENNWAHLQKEILKRTLCVLPTHFGHGLIGNCLTPLLAGCDLFLYQYPGIMGAAKLGPVIDQNAITFMSSVPSFWKVALKASPMPVKKTLKQISVGSAPLSKDHWRAISEWAGIKNVVNMYGITETANWAVGASAATYGFEDGVVGTMWGGEAAVMTKDGKQAKTGEGEILLKTPSVMKGYLKRPDLTRVVLKDGWYRTGDWGAIGDDGVIRLLGRTKTEINKAGIKILPEEVDMLLERHPDVAEACAFAAPDPISGETVAVAVAAKPGADLTAETLRAWCRERIRPDGVPERWYFVAEIPKTDRGKVNRAVVRDHCLEGGSQ